MKTIWLASEESGIPERFDYEEKEIPDGTYDKNGVPVYRTVLDFYHVQGYHYQDRSYMGWYNNIYEAEDFIRTCDII